MARRYGVVLAGGRGTRMGALTTDTPKPLLAVAGRPIIEHTLHRGRGLVDAWVIVVGYRGELIRDRFGASYEDTPIRYAVQEEPLGTAHALDCALQAMADPPDSVLVTNGDAVVPRSLQSALLEQATPAVGVRHDDDPSNGIVVVEDGWMVDAIEEPDEPPANTVLTGAYAFEPDVAEYLDVEISPSGEYWLTDALRAYAADRTVRAVTYEGPVFAANTPGELKRLGTAIEKGQL